MNKGLGHLPNKLPWLAEVLTEAEGNLEWLVERDAEHQFPSWDSNMMGPVVYPLTNPSMLLSLSDLTTWTWGHFCDPMDCHLSGPSVYGISQARVLEWVSIFFSRGSSQPRYQTHVSCIAGEFFTTELTGKPQILYSFLYRKRHQL